MPSGGGHTAVVCTTGVAWGQTHACAHCLDTGVQVELDGIPWLRRPHDIGSAQHGRQSSCEAHAARRRLHVASGAAADGASARTRGSSAWHMAVRTGLSARCSARASRHSGSVTTQKRVSHALKWWPRQLGGVGQPEATRPEVLDTAQAGIGADGWWPEQRRCMGD
jgi:hypothetical protein